MTLLSETDSTLEAIDETEVFVETELEKEYSPEDTEGCTRPSYLVAGHRIIFRSRQEAPEFDVPYAVIDAQVSPPVTVKRHEENVDKIEKYNQSPHASLEVARYAVVTNTPEGIVGAALVLGGPDDRLQAMYDHLRAGEYGQDEMTLIDSIIATTNKRQGEYYRFDTDGHAVVLASLLGDEKAQAIVSQQIKVLAEEQKNYKRGYPEKEYTADEQEAAKEHAIDPHEVVLVHSTAYDIRRDEDGTVILNSAGDLREDRLPRASLHFTVNGVVTSHIGGQWDTSQRVILGNFQSTVDANRAPDVMNPVDTFFDLNPGEPLRLPGAIIVEGVADQVELLQDDGEFLRYKLADTYTDEERTRINELASKESVMTRPGGQQLSDAEILRQAVLHRGMRALGAKKFVTPMAHHTNNDSFDKAYHNLGVVLGTGHLLHQHTIEGSDEFKPLHDLLKDQYGGQKYREHLPVGNQSSAYVHLPLPVRRQIVASGYTQPEVLRADWLQDYEKNKFNKGI
jgi:hypothetical protein